MGLLRDLLGLASSQTQTQRAGGPNSWTPALTQLASAAAPYRHADFAFLHSDYSPGSRVPCMDFTPFLVDCINRGDHQSIGGLMVELVSGNPGLGGGPDWAVRDAIGVLGIPFERYVTSPDARVFSEIRALFALATKGGGGREFWVTDEKASLFSWALACHPIEWLPAMVELRDKANSFIREMRKDTPYWVDFPLFEDSAWGVPSIVATATDEYFNALPIGARIHLLSLVQPKKGGRDSLLKGTTFAMRDLGVNPRQTADLLLGSGFCSSVIEASALESVWTKDELISVLSVSGVDFRKSWNKARMLEELQKAAPESVQQACEQHRTAAVKPEYLGYLQERLNHANQAAKAVSLLFYA